MPANESHFLVSRSKLLKISIGVFLVAFILIGLISAPLATSAAPSGIVSFELAGTPERAGEILASWDAHIQRYAAFSLGFDYLFMLAYAAALSLACLSAGSTLRERDWPLHRHTNLVVMGVWVAAGLDAVENLALAWILLESALSPWAQIARYCALAKFFLLFIGLIFAFYGLVVFVLRKLLPPRLAEIRDWLPEIQCHGATFRPA